MVENIEIHRYIIAKNIKKENRIPHVIEDAAVPIEKLPELFNTLEDQ